MAIEINFAQWRKTKPSTDTFIKKQGKKKDNNKIIIIIIIITTQYYFGYEAGF